MHITMKLSPLQKRWHQAGLATSGTAVLLAILCSMHTYVLYMPLLPWCCLRACASTCCACAEPCSELALPCSPAVHEGPIHGAL